MRFSAGALTVGMVAAVAGVVVDAAAAVVTGRAAGDAGAPQPLKPGLPADWPGVRLNWYFFTSVMDEGEKR